MDEVRMTLRLPSDIARFIATLSKENRTSRNAEIIRSVKERMKAEEVGSNQK